jgi:hypothetical protein
MSSKPVIHRNSPLSLEARRRLVERCRTRPIAHVAAEMGISRACASNWVNRYRRFGELGLVDRPSTPRRQPAATGSVLVLVLVLVARIEVPRRTASGLPHASPSSCILMASRSAAERSHGTWSRLASTAGNSSTRMANRIGSRGESSRAIPAISSTST